MNILYFAAQNNSILISKVSSDEKQLNVQILF